MSELVVSDQNPSRVLAGCLQFPPDRRNGNGRFSFQAKTAPVPPWLDDAPEDKVRKELARILDSQEFKDKPMLRGFLSYVVEKTLAGRAYEIKGYTVATRVFGRKTDFDPTVDPIVRIQAGRLRRALEHFYARRGCEGELRIEIGKGSYVPSFSPLCADAAESQRVVETVRPGGGDSRGTGDAACLPSSIGPAIAVMPITALTDGGDQACIAEGLSEELMNELGCCNGFKVYASHSGMRGKRESIDAREVGLKLGVPFFLEGSLRKSDQVIKFNIRLIDAATGMQIWGERYRRNLDEGTLVDLQEEVARSVAGSIGGLFGVIPRLLSSRSRLQHPEKPGLYEVFLEFSRYMIELSPRAHARAADALKRAYPAKPDTGMALSILACLYANEYAFRRPQAGTHLDEAVSLAREATLLEPQNVPAQTLLAYVLFLSGEKELFFREAEAALRSSRHSSNTNALLGWTMALFGEWERGLFLLEREMEASPIYPGWFRIAPCLNGFRLHQFDAAWHDAGKINTRDLFWDSLLRAAALGRIGKERDAAKAAEEILGLVPDFRTRGREMIGVLVKDDRIVEVLLEGLEKAGLHI